MNYKNRDDELIRKQREAQALYSATNNNKKNQSGYSLNALQKLASGNYRKVPELQPTKAQPTTQQKPSTRYNQNVSTQEKKSTRDTKYDNDFDEFHKYRVGDKIGVMDYDANTDREVEHWRNLKTEIMNKNKWSEKEFDDKWDAYYKERSQKEANEEVGNAVEFAKQHPVLGTLLQGVYTPQAMLEGAGTMLTALPFVSDKYRAQSADDTNFTGTRAKEGIKQAVKDEHIKSDIGKGAYDIATSLGDMMFAAGIPVLGTASLGGQTAARQNMNALERGVDPTKASRTGAISGAASALMNKVGFDNAVNTQAKTALGSVLQGMGIEGAENVAEDTFNLLVDTLMNKDKSQLSSLHDYYVSQGMSDKEATAKATTDTLKDLALSGVSGAAFGGVMRGVRNLPELASDVKALGKYASMDNRGSVDPKALAEEARLNVKAPAKVEGERAPADVIKTDQDKLNNLIKSNKEGSVELDNGQVIEKYSMKYMKNMILKEYKDNGFMPDDDAVYIRYKDGTEAVYGGGDDTSNMKLTNIDHVIYANENTDAFAGNNVSINPDSDDPNDIRWTIDSYNPKQAAIDNTPVKQEVPTVKPNESGYKVGDRVLYSTSDFDGKFSSESTIKEVYPDHVIVDVPGLSDHVYIDNDMMDMLSPSKVKVPEVESPDRALTPQELDTLQKVVDEADAQNFITELRDRFANAKPVDQADMLVDGGYYRDHVQAGEAYSEGKFNEAIEDYLSKMERNGNPAPTKNTVDTNNSSYNLKDKYNDDWEQMRRGVIKEYTNASDEQVEKYKKELDKLVSFGGWSKADPKVLDDYVEHAPTYQGQISRGMHFEPGDGSYDNFMNQVRESGTVTMGKPSSWTTDPETSRLYSHMGDDTYDSVEIVCNQNRTSTPINYINMQGEDEVLSSSKASWTVLNEETVTRPNGSRKTILYVAETGDKTPPKNAVVMPDEVEPNNVDKAKYGIDVIPGEYKQAIEDGTMTTNEVLSRTSPQFQDVQKRLFNNQDVDINEIRTLPEVQWAFDNMKEGRSIDNYANSPERKALDERLEKEYYDRGSAVIDKNGNTEYNGDIDQGNLAIFVVGYPGSGKTSTIVDPLSQHFRARILDADDIKAVHPDNNNGLDDDYIHAECMDIMRKVSNRALKNNENVIIPTVGGGTPEDLAKRILAVQNFGHDNNYRIAVVYNDFPFNKSVNRTLSRYMTKGRFTPPDVVYRFKDQPPTNVAELLERGNEYGVNLSGYSRIDSDVSEGEQPIIRETGGTLQELPAGFKREGNSLDGTGDTQYGNRTGLPFVKQQNNVLSKQPTSEVASSMPLNEPTRRSFFDDVLPRTDETGISKVGTNTMVNSNVYTKEQIDSDPVISELNKYAKANNDTTYNQAKDDVIADGATLLDEYTSGKRSINNDLDVDRAMILLTDMSNKINAGDTSLEAQRNLLFSKLRQAGTLYGQTIQAFKKWNNTAEGAIANGEGILHEPVKGWKSQNKQKVELNGRIAKALEQMGVDSSMRNKTTAEKTHEQVKQGVKNVLAKEYGSIDNYFNDNDIEVLANWAENKVPVWQITDEIEHKLSTGEWYTLDESTQPKYPINQKLKNALDDLVAQEPTVKEPPTLDEIRNEVRTTLDKEMARTGEFTDDDVNYIASLIQNGATKQELSEALNTKMATGKFGISPETQQQVTDLFTYANRFDPNSKQAFDLKTAAYKLIADEAVSEDATPFEKFESWRYLAMLGNPKTMVRNWIGNKMFGAVTGVSNNLSAALEAGVDKASKAMGGNGIQRTKAFLNPVDDRALIKAAGEDGEAHRYTTLNGTKYEKGTKDAIKQQKSVFNSKLLRLYEAATDRGVSDYSAVKKKYSTSLAGYMKANGLDESAFDANDRYTALKDKARTQLLTDAEKTEMNSLKSTVDLLEKARDYAVKQAEYATFHEDNAFAKWLTKASNSAPGPLKAVIEGLVPFKKTPANILRSGTEYSPIGFLNSIWHTGKLVWENTGSRKGNLDDTYTKKSKLTGKTKEVNKSLAADVLDSWSKTLTGSALVGLGYYLKNKGIINSSNKDEKWQDDLEGIQNYSITINGKTYTLDWAAPAVMPLLMGAEISKVKERNGMLDRDVYENLDEIIGTANALLDPIFETSMLQGIKNTFESAANDIKYDENGALGGILGSMAFNTGLGYLTQGIPTLSGQIARTVDNTRRSTDTVTDQSFMGSAEKQGRKLMNKIPGLSTLNNPYYDSYGRTQNNSPWNDPIRNFLYQSLSPAYIRDINTTPADEAARNAYYGLGEPNDEGKQLPMMDSKVFPSWKSKVTANGEKLSPDEMATYRKESGEAQYAIRDALTKEDWFNNLDAPKQAEILKKVNTLVDKIGKDSVDKLDSGSKDFEAYQSGGVEGLINKWGTDEGSNKAKEATGLSGNTNAIKEINAAYAEGDTKKAEELTEKYAKYNKERERINEKYGVNIKMADFTEREDANPGSNEQWAKEHSNGTTTTTKTTTKTTVPKVTTKSNTGTSTAVDTAGYEKQVERAGKQKTRFTNDLPKLKELNYGKSEMYTYAYAINQDSSLTPQSFNTQFKKMDLDNGGSMSQDEMIEYFNRNNTSEQQANYLWRTYGENKGNPWKAVPVLNDGTWKKKKK